ncbi:uncharacterized protein HaLaN_19393 [Haematococcus lacustris]|uniref:Uncharacterized protein n=1 Tax=Haematococcus lacustris TaxID=44745 RepID=A0A699ZTJ0_HAELA|nr:uncharacterized protein HaLaN_19393 [Haematococcus lacustris]
MVLTSPWWQSRCTPHTAGREHADAAQPAESPHYGCPSTAGRWFASRRACGLRVQTYAGQEASRGASAVSCAAAVLPQVLPGAKFLGDILTSSRQYHSSPAASQESATPDVVKETLPQSYEPERKYRGNLADKELWHEAWMYEDRFGTEENPIFVPCLESERIIGVTDPEDDNLVVWGILRESEGPRWRYPGPAGGWQQQATGQVISWLMSACLSDTANQDPPDEDTASASGAAAAGMQASQCAAAS